MKKWIKFVLKANSRLDKLSANIERKIDRLSCNLIRPASELVEEIFSWQEFLRRLVNLRVIYERLHNELTFDEWHQLLNNCENIMQKCSNLLYSYGYNEEKFQNEYKKTRKIVSKISSIPL